MKSKMVLIVITMLFQYSITSGQTFASATEINRQKMPIYSTTNLPVNRPKQKMCGSTIAGIVAMPIGLTTVLAGSFVADDGLLGGGDKKDGNIIIAAGGIVFFAGAGLLIKGIILDKHPNSRFGVTFSKNNEIGLTHDF